MSNLEKINIYVPEHIGTILNKDAMMFEIMKYDGWTINRNKFLSMLILGYYTSYVTECWQKYEAIMNELVEKEIDFDISSELADRILKKIILPEVPLRKGKKTAKLSLKPTKDTEGLIRIIKDEIGADDYISQYFCRMLMSYCEKSFSERERIIFRENYEWLKDACDRRRPIKFSTIWNPEIICSVIPYKLVVGHEEMYNYLLCSEINRSSGEQEAKSYRLNRIVNINYSQENNLISEKVIRYLDKMIKYGSQYMINDDEESCVRLTELGKRYFRRIYYGRPEVDRTEENEDGYYCYFKGSKDQVFFYFRKFGFEAEIISPESLRNRMKEFHQKANENYK